MTWHATAGSNKATAQAEVNVLLKGSATAPPPIAQFMLAKDGTVYVVAAGRCNHNKVGWDGPNEKLGNTALIGIEMQNDNKGGPWPAVQLDAARRLTAALFKKLGTDPRKRLAAHFEHQPWATRPLGEGSTKSDPAGVKMAEERNRVYVLMNAPAAPKPAPAKPAAAPVAAPVVQEEDEDMAQSYTYEVPLAFAYDHEGKALDLTAVLVVPVEPIGRTDSLKVWTGKKLYVSAASVGTGEGTVKVRVGIHDGAKEHVQSVNVGDDGRVGMKVPAAAANTAYVIRVGRQKTHADDGLLLPVTLLVTVA